MKLLVFFAFITTIACSKWEYPIHPGVGAIYKGPNSETIIRGPDGSVITSEAEGGSVATDHSEAVHAHTPVAEAAQVSIEEAVNAQIPIAQSHGLIAPQNPVEHIEYVSSVNDGLGKFAPPAVDYNPSISPNHYIPDGNLPNNYVSLNNGYTSVQVNGGYEKIAAPVGLNTDPLIPPHDPYVLYNQQSYITSNAGVKTPIQQVPASPSLKDAPIVVLSKDEIEDDVHSVAEHSAKASSATVEGPSGTITQHGENSVISGPSSTTISDSKTTSEILTHPLRQPIVFTNLEKQPLIETIPAVEYVNPLPLTVEIPKMFAAIPHFVNPVYGIPYYNQIPLHLYKKRSTS